MSDETTKWPNPAIGAVPDEDVARSGVGNPALPNAKLARVPTAEDMDRPHPLYCVWEITLACDLGCAHCGSRAGDERPGELNTAQCLDVVRQLDEIGVREVTLIGGEAYLRDDWHVIAAEISRRGMRCSMTTGARNLTDERLQQAVDAGLRTISISIDGLERTHDAQRGAKGSWRAAVDAARRVAASPIRLATNTQINKLSMPELPAIADLLGEIGSKAWQIQLTVPMGRAADRPDLLVQPTDLLELFPLLVWINETKLKPSGVKLFPGNNIGYFGPYERLLRYGGVNGAHWQGCSAGQWSIGLEADGKIKGCPSLPSNDWTGGYLPDDDLAATIANATELKFIRERTVEDLWGYCRTCYYADICKAGCTWTSHVFFGRSGNNPYCIHRALQHEAKGLRERLVRAEAAPGDPFDHGRFDIVVEPLPDDVNPEAPSVGDVPLDLVTALQTDAGSIWDKATIIDRLRRAPTS